MYYLTFAVKIYYLKDNTNVIILYMQKEDEILLSSIEDKFSQCQSQNIMTSTQFLDPRQAVMAMESFGKTRHLFFGGYEDAERRIMVFLPDYLADIPAEDQPLAVLRVSSPKGSRQLSHRDYLGSILALGVNRSVVGDIIVKPNEADIIILKSMGEFFLTNYDQAAHNNLTAQILPIEQLDRGEIRVQEKRDTIASLRLDNFVSSAFNLSRTKAQDAVKSGLVFTNNLQILKPDFTVKEGDKIVLRGFGKAVLKEVGGRTKKDRLVIIMELYK